MSRSDWERGNPKTLALADVVVNCLNRWKVADDTLTLSYKKYFIGLTCQGKPIDFAIFMPWGRGEKRGPSFQPRCPDRDDLDSQLLSAGLGAIYRRGNGRNRYVLKFAAEALCDHGSLVLILARLAYFHHDPRRRPVVGIQPLGFTPSTEVKK